MDILGPKFENVWSIFGNVQIVFVNFQKILGYFEIKIMSIRKSWQVYIA